MGTTTERNERLAESRQFVEQSNRKSEQQFRLPSRSVVLAVEYLVKVVEEDMKLSNGSTALHWHLIGVIQQHTEKSTAEKTEE